MTADTLPAPAANGATSKPPASKAASQPAAPAAGAHVVTSSSVLHRNLNVTLPIVTHARGSYLYTSSGQRILDGSGGAAVVSVGHGVPAIVSAVSAQISTLPYVSSALFAVQPAEALAARMCADAGMARAVFLSGGSEAVESAIKLARQYHVERGCAERTEFIARDASYHGNTLGALALGRHMARREFNEPLLSARFHAVSPCNAYRYQRPGESDAAYVQRLAEELDAKIRSLGPETVAAFFAEPVVGAAAGCVPFVAGYIRAMKRVCERHGVLLVLDEIMCGAGRTGRLHAWMHDVPPASLPVRFGGELEGEGDWGEEARPHIQTLGKGLCGGYAPLSAVLVSEKVTRGLEGGSGAFRNGYTFQSSGTGVAAGLAVYDYMEKHNLVAQCAKRGAYLRAALDARVRPLPHVGDVRGLGLFQGVEFVADVDSKQPFAPADHVADRVAAAILERGAAVYHGAATKITGDHIMLCPPYTVSEAEINELVDAVVAGIRDVFPE